MNRCYWCGKFRPWQDLVWAYEFNAGYMEPKEILECRRDTGCDRRENEIKMR